MFICFFVYYVYGSLFYYVYGYLSYYFDGSLFAYVYVHLFLYVYVVLLIAFLCFFVSLRLISMFLCLSCLCVVGFFVSFVVEFVCTMFSLFLDPFLFHPLVCSPGHASTSAMPHVEPFLREEQYTGKIAVLINTYGHYMSA